MLVVEVIVEVNCKKEWYDYLKYLLLGAQILRGPLPKLNLSL